MTAGAGRRVLVVEDEVLIAMHLEAMLGALGHEVVAMATRIDIAMELASASAIDFAVLDVNVSGAVSFPVADILNARAIPFAFATGYGVEGLTEAYRDHPALRKPYARDDLKRTIARLVCPQAR